MPTFRAGKSRREFLRSCAWSAAVLTGASLARVAGAAPLLSSARRAQGSSLIRLDADWRFGGPYRPGSDEVQFDERGFEAVTLPHCVAKLSWRKWDPASWAGEWIYRKHFELRPELCDSRVLLEFEGVMTGATPVLNGRRLEKHLGGYLPFSYEVTGQLRPGPNTLAVIVDGRWQNVPPEGSPKGAASIDYLEPAGIHRPVRLRCVPGTYIKDVFAKPIKVLDPARSLEVRCTLDSADVPAAALRVRADLLDRGRIVASRSEPVALRNAGETEVVLELSRLGNVALWGPDAPRLYEVIVSLFLDDRLCHQYRTRIGFREARFEVDGFFLNGSRFQIFGLDRHELFPYAGPAMPARVMHRDAEILRHQFNCNFVRCSHYPQSEAFLDACDELGLLVWEELAGWQYIGDEAWQQLAVRDVGEMVRRDRNHAGVVIWGVRINESRNFPEFYRRTKDAAKALDDSRPTSGAMNRYSTKDWLQDVYAYDDYHAAPDGSVGVREPLPGVPYFLTEGVGQFAYGKGGFGRKYRRAGDLETQQQQAICHAQIHDRARRFPRHGGVLAWCAFDYGSLINPQDGVKCPGIADVFRIPKLGASFYLAQGDPAVRPVIEPNFYWDFGPASPEGPGESAAIFSNCERLELFVARRHLATALPDRKNYPNLAYPPFFVNLKIPCAEKPELRIDGFVRQRRVLSRKFSGDPRSDQLWFKADDKELKANGSDATRLVFRAVDKYGAPRPFATGVLKFEVDGPGVLLGDNPFDWGDSGGAGAVWVRTVAGRSGKVRIVAIHEALGRKQVLVRTAA